MKRSLSPCAFLLDVLCSYRKTEQFSVMDKCFGCPHYARFMREMDKQDQEEDAQFLEESERVNRFARCHFEDCFCDGDYGKLVCFRQEAVGSSSKTWKCPRFDVGKLKPDSVIRQAYEDLVGGGIP